MKSYSMSKERMVKEGVTYTPTQVVAKSNLVASAHNLTSWTPFFQFFQFMCSVFLEAAWRASFFPSRKGINFVQVTKIFSGVISKTPSNQVRQYPDHLLSPSPGTAHYTTAFALVSLFLCTILISFESEFLVDALGLPRGRVVDGAPGPSRFRCVNGCLLLCAFVCVMVTFCISEKNALGTKQW